MSEIIMTVTGGIDATEMGRTLPHEHIIVDFVGADEASPDRYDDDEVKQVMTPYLLQAKDQGYRTFVECTPMYLARDPVLFKELSINTGLNILTNTGQYKEPALPAETFRMSAEELAASWIREHEEGIGDTGIRPGFIKTAVNPDRLIPIQQKVTRAAGITSRETGLTIATHTGVAVAAMEVLDILDSEEVDPRKWIYVHAQNEQDMGSLVEVAKRGAWIELDGLRAETADKHLKSFLALLEAGFADRIMLSHDAGWYHVGEAGGGTVRPFTFLIDEFVPMLRDDGVDEKTIWRIIEENPSKAFALGTG